MASNPAPPPAQQLPAADEVHARLTALHAEGKRAEADEYLEDMVGKLMNAQVHADAQALVASLPPEWVAPRVQAMDWMSRSQGGTHEQAMEARKEAEAAYEAGERNFRLLYYLADTWQLDGLDDLALGVMREALAGELRPTDRILMLHIHADTLQWRKEHGPALESARELLDLATRHTRPRHVALAHGLIGDVYHDTGNLTRADRHYLRALHVLRQIGDHGQLVIHLNNYAVALLGWGRPRQAEQVLTEARSMPLTARYRGWLALSTATLHHQYGQHSQALVSTAEAVELLHEAVVSGAETTARLMRAERLAIDGQHEGAAESWRAAQALVGGDHRYQAQTDFTGGVLAWVHGDAGEAERRFREAGAAGHLLLRWDQARLALYRIALARQRGETPATGELEAALQLAHNDYPLITDAPVLADTLQWLAEQPGWRERLAAVFDTPPEGTVSLRMEPFGPLEVYAGAECLRFPLKRASELFAFLTFHGPATRADILNALFDGSTDERAVDLFKKTLRALRNTLQPLLPEGAAPLPRERQRYRLHPLLSVSVSWRPPVLPAPGVRESGPLDVRGPFLADARGEWVHDVRANVHETLRQQLQTRAENGDPTVQAALRAAEALE